MDARFLLADDTIKTNWETFRARADQRVKELARFIPTHLAELRKELEEAQKKVETLPARIAEYERRLEVLQAVNVPERPFSEVVGILAEL